MYQPRSAVGARMTNDQRNLRRRTWRSKGADAVNERTRSRESTAGRTSREGLAGCVMMERGVGCMCSEQRASGRDDVSNSVAWPGVPGWIASLKVRPASSTLPLPLLLVFSPIHPPSIPFATSPRPGYSHFTHHIFRSDHPRPLIPPTLA